MARTDKSFYIGRRAWLIITVFLSSILTAYSFPTGILNHLLENNEFAIKIYGNPFSITTTEVLAAAYEIDLEFEFVLIGVHKPFAQMPIFEVGDVKLVTESTLLVLEIANSFVGKGTQLLSKNMDQKVAIVKQLIVVLKEFDKAGIRLVWERRYMKLYKEEMNATNIKVNEAILVKTLDLYEAHLSRFKYMGGDSFSVADLHHLPILQWLLDTPTWKLFSERPHVHAWCKKILARPAWSKVLTLQKSFDSLYCQGF